MDDEWKWTSFLLCGFGLFKELRPSEPFVTDYIIDFKNVTAEQVIHDVFPVSTYTILGTLVVVFLVTDFLRYRPIIILQATSYVFTWILLIWGQKLLSLQIVQVFYGVAVSADVAYYTYIYAKVSRQHYKQVTSYTRASVHIGKFLSGTLSQILISLSLMNFHQLNYITLSSVIIALLLACLLPKVRESIYFYRVVGDGAWQKEKKVGTVPELSDSGGGEYCEHLTTTRDQVLIRIPFLERVRKAYPHLWSDFKVAYTNPYVLRWSIWWGIATAGNLQAQNYIQALWKVIERSSEDAGSTEYNGAVNAIQCLLSAIFSFAVGHIHIHWNRWGEVFLCFISLLQGSVLVWLSLAESVATGYGLYLTFRVLYQVVITIANVEVAQGIRGDSCGLIFGMNTFLALVIQTALTLVVSDARGLALNERSQFMVYGGYFGVLGVSFLIAAIFTFLKFPSSGKLPKCETPVETEGFEDKIAEEQLLKHPVTIPAPPTSN